MSLARRTMRGISLHETRQAAGPPRCGVPCSHPAISFAGALFTNAALAAQDDTRHFAARKRAKHTRGERREAAGVAKKRPLPRLCRQRRKRAKGDGTLAGDLIGAAVSGGKRVYFMAFFGLAGRLRARAGPPAGAGVPGAVLLPAVRHAPGGLSAAGRARAAGGEAGGQHLAGLPFVYPAVPGGGRPDRPGGAQAQRPARHGAGESPRPAAFCRLGRRGGGGDRGRQHLRGGALRADPHHLLHRPGTESLRGGRRAAGGAGVRPAPGRQRGHPPAGPHGAARE